MRFSVVSVLALAPLALAVPSARGRLNIRQGSCVEACLTQLEGYDTGCASDDWGCLCANGFAAGTYFGCLRSTCTGDDLTDALTGSEAICAGADVPTPNTEAGAVIITSATTTISSAPAFSTSDFVSASADSALSELFSSADGAVSSAQSAVSSAASAASGVSSSIAAATSNASASLASATSSAGAAASSASAKASSALASLSSAAASAASGASLSGSLIRSSVASAVASATSSGGAVPTGRVGGGLVGLAIVAGGALLVL